MPILLVEDHADVRTATCLFLESHGYTVITACDGNDALHQLRAGLRPSVILLDVRMPIMNGHDFWRVQSADPEWARIPVIGMSAYKLDRSDLPVTGFWLKGDPTKLLALLETHAPTARIGRDRAGHAPLPLKRRTTERHE